MTRPRRIIHSGIIPFNLLLLQCGADTVKRVDALGHVAFAEELDVCLGPTEFQLPKPDGADSPTLTASSDPCPD